MPFAPSSQAGRARREPKPHLSIVIPVRNGRAFVADAIASASAVPIEPTEVVVVDDGSTDGTLELVENLARHDPRIVVLKRTRDHGVAAARNAGIAAARSDLVCFLDADDTLQPSAVAARVAYHEQHPHIVFSFCNYQSVLPGGVLENRYDDHCPNFQKAVGIRTDFVDLGRDGFRLLYAENPVCTTGTMARRQTLMALGGFDRALRQAEDWDMWVRLSRAGGVAYSPIVEAFHTARPGSLSTDVADRTHHIALVVRRHRPAALRDCPRAALAATSYLQTARAELARATGRHYAALFYYAAAVVLSPDLPLVRELARSAAVLVGLRSGRGPTLDERIRAATANTPVT